MTRTVVIVGVGSGLGSSLARTFATEGNDVALLARSAEYLRDLAEEITDTTAGEALAVPTDVRDSAAVERAFDTIRETFGPVDVLVNNVSASATTSGGVLDVTEDDLTGAWDVRVAGQFRCAKEAVADMADADGGTIFFTNSGQARNPDGNVTFSTGRHAVRGMARSMASDLGDHDIQTIHVIVDGWIASPELRSEFPDHDRWMEPDEIATVYRRLADDPPTVHTSEVDLRHPEDDLSF